jgi:hypothetical protein
VETPETAKGEPKVLGLGMMKWRRLWREGDRPRVTGSGKIGSGRSPGSPCHMSLTRYVRQQQRLCVTTRGRSPVGNSARRDLCGGCRVTGIPTATGES